MPLSFFWSAQVSDVFVLLRPLLSFFRFGGLAHAVEDAVRLLVFVSFAVAHVLVVVFVTLVLAAVVVTLVLAAVVVSLVIAAVVVVLIAILLAVDEAIFIHAPAPTPFDALAVVALILS